MWNDPVIVTSLDGDVDLVLTILAPKELDVVYEASNASHTADAVCAVFKGAVVRLYPVLSLLVATVTCPVALPVEMAPVVPCAMLGIAVKPRRTVSRGS
jgi:hypothetical protein